MDNLALGFSFSDFLLITIVEEVSVGQCQQERPKGRDSQSSKRNGPRPKEVKRGPNQERTHDDSRRPRRPEHAKRKTGVAFAEGTVGGGIDHR